MVKEFIIPCNFGGQSSPVSLYIGNPNPAQHPLNFQSKWLSETKGGSIPQDIMDSISKIFTIAQNNNVSFEELCYYAVTVANSGSKASTNLKFNKLLSKI